MDLHTWLYANKGGGEEIEGLNTTRECVNDMLEAENLPNSPLLPLNPRLTPVSANKVVLHDLLIVPGQTITGPWVEPVTPHSSRFVLTAGLRAK